METSNKTAPEACPRCQGKMFPDADSGGVACFTCGNVLYPFTPPPPPRGAQRNPTPRKSLRRPNTREAPEGAAPAD